MSPASRKSKSKDKRSGKEGKSSLKTSGHIDISNGTPASGYNPVLGTFETASVTSVGPLHVNSRFQNIDETNDLNGNSPGTGIDNDSISNNGSWSGESEDHKEKPSQSLPRQEIIPGADNDKREKIRQKNEKKHQRQKERRAQEWHDKCKFYLMTRKLEALSQQLVPMGFSHDKSMMALIQTEGRVEEAVALLLEGSEEDTKKEHNLNNPDKLKIDISEELARIAEIENRFKASKQEVERAVVSCEGDLEKAEEIIKAQKEAPPAVPSKHEDNGKLSITSTLNSVTVLPKSTSFTSLQQQKRDERDFNYTKAPTTVRSSVDPGAKTMQVLKNIPPKTDWTKQQQITMPPEKNWATAGSNPSTPFSLASPLPMKADVRYVGNEFKNLQIQPVREPVTVMQRPQSINSKHAPSTSISSSPPGPTAMSWYSNSLKNGLVPSVAQFYGQPQYQSSQQYMPNSSSMNSLRENGFQGRGGLPSLAPASSLGLYSGPSGASSQVDWSTGSSMSQFDYTNVDWSLDRGSLFLNPNGLSNRANYIQSNAFGHGAVTNTSIGKRPYRSNSNGATVQDGNGEWNSAFEERDIFSLPREFVSNPSP